MIIKNKDPISSTDRRLVAGDKQEQDVAFYLRREFKDTVNVFVFNDLRIKYNGEVAQIDHLILYEYGFILIESKSITGEVAVNSDEEWSRSYNGKWSGMPSPIQQVELQERLLRDLLHENRKKLLGKILFGTLQTTFGGRNWDNFCAISSNSMIQRDNMPDSVSSKLFKSEFLVKKLKDIIPETVNRGILKLNNSPWFSPDELEKICDFLLAEHQPVHSVKVNAENTTASTDYGPAATPYVAKNIVTESTTAQLSCKKCNTTDGLQSAWGKFGYYVKCTSCGTNTAMKQNCCNCSSNNTKVSKKKALYSLTCQDCGEIRKVFIQG